MIRTIIDRYNKMSIAKKASLWFLICGFMQRGISIITTPIFTRLLNSDEYGVYTVFSSWLELITVVVTLKIGVGSYLQGLVKYDYKREPYTSALLGLSTTSIIAWFIIYYVLRGNINQRIGMTTFLMICMFVMMWSTSIFEFWAAKQRVEFNYRKLIVLTVISSIAKPLISIVLICMTTDYKAEARILGLAIVELLLFIWLFIGMMRQGKVFYHRGYWVSALRYNLPLIPHYLAALILAHSDRIMIKTMIDYSAAGKYGLAYNIASIMRLFNTSLNNVLTPWTYQSIKAGNINKIGKYGLMLMSIIAALNLLLMACAPEIMLFFAPREYYDALACVYPVSMAVFFMFMYDTFSKFAMYFEKTRFVMYVSVASAILNVILNYYLISKFGYIAAAYTTLFCYVLYGIGHYFFMRVTCKKNDVDCPYNAKKILGISFAFVGFGVALMCLKEVIIARYSILLFTAVFACVFKERLFNIFKGLRKE